MSCVIPIPRLPKPHSCFPTDPDSICLPTSVLTVPLGLLYSAVVPKGAFSIRDQHKPPNPLVSTLGSNWRGAQARWFNANHQAEAFGQAPILSMVLSQALCRISQVRMPEFLPNAEADEAQRNRRIELQVQVVTSMCGGVVGDAKVCLQ